MNGDESERLAQVYSKRTKDSTIKVVRENKGNSWQVELMDKVIEHKIGN